MTSKIKVMSWNVRGLGDGRKRRAVKELIEFYNPAIVCLQETHKGNEDDKMFCTFKYKYEFHATYSTYSRGVSILISNAIRFTCKQCIKDPAGRYLMLLCSINDRIIFLVNVYIPPPYKDDVLKKVFEKMAQLPDVPTVIIGDFNNVLNEELDRQSNKKSNGRGKVTRWASQIQEMGLSDIWRVRFPVSKEYSCYSSTYGSLSRIDMALGNGHFLPLVKIIQYEARGISDHSPLTVTLEWTEHLIRPMWKVNPQWLSLIPESSQIKQLLMGFFGDNKGSSSAMMVWDTMKAYLRGLIIKEISKIKLATRQWEEELTQRVKQTEQEYTSDPNREKFGAWQDAQNLYKKLVLTKAENNRFLQNQKHYEMGEQVGHMLAMITRNQEGPSTIAAIEDRKGTVKYDTEGIQKIFVDFYSQLYESENLNVKEKTEQFLDNLTMPKLTSIERESLDIPITMAELEEAVGQIQNNKAPGMDGLSVEIYKLYGQILIPELLEVLNEACHTGTP